MKTWLVTTVLLGCGMAAFAQQSGAPDQAPQLIDLPAADLASALAYLAQRYNIDLVYDPSLIKGLNAPRLGGYMTGEALTETVKPSGLSIVENQPGSYLVTKPPMADKGPIEASPYKPGPVEQKAPTAVMDTPLREVTDISLIPLSVIDHIEVLTDGASAVYGSDAVAGVVNIVTRSALEGAESIGRFGRSTEGGGGQSMAAQLFGHSWATGSALIDLEYSDQEDLDASQRDWRIVDRNLRLNFVRSFGVIS